MAQVTDSLFAEFAARINAGQHINATINEEAQLLHAFQERKQLREYAEDRLPSLIRWLDAKGAASTVCKWGDSPGTTIRALIEEFAALSINSTKEQSK